MSFELLINGPKPAPPAPPPATYCTAAALDLGGGATTHDKGVEELAAEGSCCQKFVCGIACAQEFDRTGIAVSYGVPIAIFAAVMVVIGLVVGLRKIKGSFKNFFVCSQTLPLFMVAITLMCQGLDSNATLGNVALSFKFGFWDGAMLPLGLGISLILNGLTVSGYIQRMGLLTLPDLFRRKYGSMMEVVVSIIEICSFTFLLAGNLVGVSLLMQFVFGLPKVAGIAVAGVLMSVYTAVGGLFSIAYVDVLQATFGFTGLLVTAIYALTTQTPHAATSMGFAVPAGNITLITPGYSGPLDCVDPKTGAVTCDNFAYPAGDMAVNPRGMTDTDAYAPFPNAIVFNWATLFVLGFGNLCALDFQQRCMASRSPGIARLGCIIAGVLLLAVCMPFGAIGGLARRYYGPDSPYAEFAADTCSAPLGIPSCAEWVPEDKMALFRFLWDKVPRVLGGWTIIAVMSASMSTADGAILATSTVMANNLLRKVPRFGASDKNLLMVVRLTIVPMATLACVVAASAYNPGYLLVVAFDVVLAGVLVPLLAAVYGGRRVSPNAGLLACLTGSILRLVLEFTLPKDGTFVMFGTYALGYGAAVPGFPSFMEAVAPGLAADAGLWDAEKDTCQQEPMRDLSGIDSLVSPVASLLVLLAVIAIEAAFPNADLLCFLPKSWRATQPLYQTESYTSDDPPPGCGVLADVRNAFSASSAAAVVAAPVDAKDVDRFRMDSAAAAAVDDTASRVGRAKMDAAKGVDGV
ncbi:MAG: Sodium:solute symporter family-domain-containing protein [Monoraphidium minutum]|nr:MAG: Sodium:solute symporter family-domain-containing protein [Monoraphidium minutum]